MGPLFLAVKHCHLDSVIPGLVVLRDADETSSVSTSPNDCFITLTWADTEPLMDGGTPPPSAFLTTLLNAGVPRPSMKHDPPMGLLVTYNVTSSRPTFPSLFLLPLQSGRQQKHLHFAQCEPSYPWLLGTTLSSECSIFWGSLPW